MLFLEKYQTILYRNNIRINVNLWFILSLIFGLVVLFSSFLLLNNLVLGFVGLFVIIDFFIGYPLILEEKRIALIEKHFPSALREIAYLLKSGGTYEYAIRELTSYEYGPLNIELENVLLRLEQGYNFEESLNIISENVNSEMVRKTISIINDTIKAGASLADILEELSEDMRKLYKLELDRKAKTMMQMLFIVSAGAIIAPGIYGLVVTLIEFLMGISATTGLANAKSVADALSVKNLLETVLTIFVFIQVLASTLMVVIMREKKYAKIFFYLPVFLGIAYVVFYMAKFLTKYLLIGAL